MPSLFILALVLNLLQQTIARRVTLRYVTFIFCMQAILQPTLIKVLQYCVVELKTARYSAKQCRHVTVSNHGSRRQRQMILQYLIRPNGKSSFIGRDDRAAPIKEQSLVNLRTTTEITIG